MATSPMSEVIHHLRKAALRGEEVDLTDGQLLECFVSGREPAALEALVRRHAGMVWGVCRRLLAAPQDAEDAFQATFLVLVRKAASVKPRELVGNWLYGVAHQTARKARATAAKRRAQEKQVREMPEPEAAPRDLWDELQPLLDQELSRLPARYRTAIVLCDLEGKTRQEAARQLGLPPGTVGSRLARARALLARRLARHGLGVSGAALAAVLSREAAAADAPAAVLSSTSKAVTLVATGQAAAGVISARAAALTEGVLKTMLLTKLKIASVVLLAGVLGTAVGASLLAGQPQAAEPAKVARPPDNDSAGGAGSAPQAAGQPRGDAKGTDLQRRLGDVEKQLRLLTEELSALRKDLKPRAAAPPGKFEFRMFNLRDLKAEEAAKILEELFNGPAKGGPPLRLRVATHAGTNTLIVQGTAQDLEVVESLITRLERLPPPKKPLKDEKN
jgi:RNA polymerase sigma factor (sigma-70 family)